MANRKQVIERFIVAEGNQHLVNQTSAGLNLYNMSTKAYRPADKMVGVVYMDNEKPTIKDKIIDTTTITTLNDLETTKVQFVQGTSISTTPNTSATNYGVTGTDVRILRSGVVDLNKPIRWTGTGELSNNASLSAYYVSGLSVVSSVNYKMRLRLKGTHLAKWMSEESMDALPVGYVTPDYTTAGLTSNIDHLYKNLAMDAIRQSCLYKNPMTSTAGSAPFLALGICASTATNPTFGATTYTLPAISALTVGTVLTFAINRTPSGSFIPQKYTIDTEFMEMITNAVASGLIASTDKVGIIDLTQAGTHATKNLFKGILFVGLRQSASLVLDETYDQKLTVVTVDADPYVELHTLPTSITMAVASRMKVSAGKGDHYIIRYKADAAGDQYSQQVWGSNFDFIPKYVPVTSGKWYTVYVFESELHETEVNGHNYTVGEIILVRTYLLVESAAPAVGATGVTGATTVADLNTYVLPLLLLAPNKIDYDSTALFV